MRTLFVDLDGVLADFDAHYEALMGVKPKRLVGDLDWRRMTTAFPRFYRHLPPMADVNELWQFVAPFRPIILTGLPSSMPHAEQDKRDWVKQYFGSRFHVIACPSKDKATFCKPGDILIDDWEKYMEKWVNNGGVWITHHNAASSIQRLAEELMRND